MADALTEAAIASMEAYYKKLKVMEIIKSFMVEQGYQIRWAQPEGGDLTNRLVVNFNHLDNDNAVSFAIDLDANKEDMEHMVLDMMLFYDQNEVTEFEKKKLREHINDTLKQQGITGAITCSGQVNEASKRVEYNDREAVKLMGTV